MCIYNMYVEMAEFTITEGVVILKSLCDSFMNEPNLMIAEKITNLIHRTPFTIIKKPNESILYPFIYHLKNNTLGVDKNVKLIEIIQIIIVKIGIQNINLFYEIYHCLRTQICQQKNSMELIETHEELKESVVLCLKDLILHSSMLIIKSFYTRQNAALLSHGIYLCVKIARMEKSTSLRIAAIDAVMSLLQVHEEADVQDLVVRNQICYVIMLYLPGVASGLLEVAVGSDIQNHKITMMAIRAWSRAISFIMQDNPQEKNNINSSSLIENIVTFKNQRELEKIAHVLNNTRRTSEWYSAVSEKFKILFQELDNLATHSHFKVRKELVEAVSLLLLNCSRNMKPCFQILLEILITLLEDENIEVAKKAKQTLQNIQDKCFQDKSMKTTVEILEENLYDFLSKMPRVIRTSGESLQLVWLNRLAGYITLLGKRKISKIFLSSAHLRKLLLTLVYISELESSHISLLEDSTNFEEALNYKVETSRKKFKFLYNSVSAEKLYSIFRILGEIGDRKTIVDSILNLTLDIPKFKRELTLMLNLILEVHTNAGKQISVYDQVIQHYTASNFWNLPVQISDEVTLQTAQNNIIQCCLLLEGLGIIAQVLQEKYQYFLLKTLYLVIDRAGSEQTWLRFTGLTTLEIIAKSQKLNSVENLFQCNFDYISYHVTLKLQRLERNPEVLNVLSVVVNYSTLDFLAHLKDIVNDLLTQSSSNIHKFNGKLFLKVFYSFILYTRRLLASRKKLTVNEESTAEPKSRKFAEIVIHSFLEFSDAKQNSKLFDKNLEDVYESSLHNSDDEIDVEDNIYETSEDNKEEKVPYFVNMIKSIMKRCLHFLPSQDITEASLAMSVLKESCIILREWENELLPVIHELWHPLVYRFQDSNPLIMIEAWHLLCSLAEVSQDFIRSRTLKQILPAISIFLKKSCKESYKKNSCSIYKFTQVFKLQKEILLELSSIVKNLKLLEKDIWNILDDIEPYLDCFQNVQLQEYCVKVYKDISEFDIDIIWIKCIDIWNRQVEHVLSESDFTTYYLKIMNSSARSNYQVNLQKILSYIYDEKHKLL